MGTLRSVRILARSPRPTTQIKRAVAVVVVVLGGTATASCGAQGAPLAAVHSFATSMPHLAAAKHSGPRVVVPAVTSTTSTVSTASVSPNRWPASVDRYLAVAEQLWRTELVGAPARRELSHVVDDPQIQALLGSGSIKQLRSYVTGRFDAQWFPNEHVSRLRILRGGNPVLDLGVAWVMGPMLQRTVRVAGRPPITFQSSVQDVIGFVRAMHNKHPAVEVVVRDAGGSRAVSLLGPAAHAPLPVSGSASIRGVRYAVRSFRGSSFVQGSVPVTVWVLLPR